MDWCKHQLRCQFFWVGYCLDCARHDVARLRSPWRDALGARRLG